MSFVKFKDSIDFDPENCMCDHIHNVDHQQTVDKIRKREIIIEPINQTYLFRSKYRYFRKVKYHTYDCGENKQKAVPNSFEFVIVLRKTHCNIFKLLH